jgi:hypothetical protein
MEMEGIPVVEYMKLDQQVNSQPHAARAFLAMQAPGRSLVKEHEKAAARKRFVAYAHGLVREIMSD